MDFGLYSCHLAIRKRHFILAGGFNLDLLGEKWIGDGETGLMKKVQKFNMWFAYVGRSVVYHQLPGSRLDQKYVNKRMSNQGNCAAYAEYREKQWGYIGLVKRIIKLSLMAFSSFIRFSLRYILRKERWRIDLAYIYYFRSKIRYSVKIAFDKEWQKLVLRNDWL
jgi:hypothetical protein